MNILVTGCVGFIGFIGFNFSKYLLEKNSKRQYEIDNINTIIL
tara:strand:+ start:294 stop:422 length:129 start_codon:yes stop_codon:yes gene_type:complete